MQRYLKMLHYVLIYFRPAQFAIYSRLYQVIPLIYYLSEFLLPDMSVAEAGTQSGNLSAGIPNITGSLSGDIYRPLGALYQSGSTTRSGYNQQVESACTLTIDASRSSGLYGNAGTVQAAAIKLVPQLRY